MMRRRCCNRRKARPATCDADVDPGQPIPGIQLGDQFAKMNRPAPTTSTWQEWARVQVPMPRAANSAFVPASDLGRTNTAGAYDDEGADGEGAYPDDVADVPALRVVFGVAAPVVTSRIEILRPPAADGRLRRVDYKRVVEKDSEREGKHYRGSSWDHMVDLLH